ncbi:MAG: hypothetical protein WD335_03290 [Candidatus Paceibacterota bacterium]
MRFSSFESQENKPLGEGEDKRTFINPDDEDKIISQLKETAEKDTPRQLKGRYYLTKIAHLLLPKKVPDIYQVREFESGQQEVDAERISHSKEHSLLQAQRMKGEDEESAREKIVEDIGEDMWEVDLELERIGLGFNIEANVGNYSKDNEGNVYYLETFKPWQKDVVDPDDLEVLFNEETLRESIEELSDEKTKEKCRQYLQRLLQLLEEEKEEIRET